MSRLSDREGRQLNLYNRTLYRVIGRTTSEDEFLLKDATPFPTDYGWTDVFGLGQDNEPHLAGSIVKSVESVRHGKEALHAPCLDIDMPLTQLTYKQLDGGLPSDGLAWKSPTKDRAAVESLFRILRDLGMTWETSLGTTKASSRLEAKIIFHPTIKIHVIPSSTEGHNHLYINRTMSWDDYEILLSAFEEAGLVSTSYVYFSRARFETHLRLPYVTKKKLPGRDSEQLIIPGGRGDTLRAMGRTLANRAYKPGPVSEGVTVGNGDGVTFASVNPTLEQSVRDSFLKRYGGGESPTYQRFLEQLELDKQNQGRGTR